MSYQLTEEEQKRFEREFLYQGQESGLIGGYCDEDFPFYYVNAKMTAMLGYDNAEELIASIEGKVSNTIHPDDYEKVQSDVGDCYEGKTYETVYRMLRKDGSSFWVVDKGKVICTEDGRLAIISNCTDMTEFVQRKNILEEQNFITDAMLKKLPGGYHRCANEAGFPFLYVSDRFLDILGWTEEEIKTEFDNKFMNLLHPDDRYLADEYVKSITSLGDKQKYQDQIYRLKGKNGYHWVSDMTIMMTIRGETVLQGFISDITEFIVEREQREKELEVLRKREVSELADELKKNEEELDEKEQYLEVICRKYMLVYYVDLNKDQAEMLRLDERSNVWKMIGMRSTRPFAYQEHIDSFAAKYVVDGKNIFQTMLNREYVIKQLKKVPRYSFRYESSPNRSGNRFYEIQVIRVNPEAFDGQAIIVSQEIDDIIAAERKQKEQLELERQYLDVLCWDYTAVYRINVYHDTGVPLKIKEDSFASQLSCIELRKEYRFSASVKEYCEKYVSVKDKEKFKNRLSIENLKKELRKKPRLVFRFQSIPNPSGYRYYEVQAIRVIDDPEDGDVLLGFRHIDDTVMREQQYQRELEERLEQERIQNESLEALGRNYDTILRIDLANNTYTKLTEQDSICDYYSENLTASEVLLDICEKVVDEKHYERMCRFLDLGTLPQRLREREYVETECISKDGSWYRMKIIVKRRDESGVVSHVLFVTRIINDEKQYEEHLIAKAEYAELANQSKSAFISQVAHDIRTPMNSILGFLEIAEANIDSKEKIQYCLGKIRTAGEFLKDLANDVLDISRMEDGKMNLQPAPLNLLEMMDDFIETIKAAHINPNQSFRVNIHDILYENVVLDSLRLKQIYTNVLSNAIKYTPDGGDVEFSLWQEAVLDEPRVQIIAEISDTGIGMSEEFKEKMFDKFERATDTRINKVSGYGLGLSIVKQMVELMGGTIGVKSRLGEGTVFRIEIEVPYVKEAVSEKKRKEERSDKTCEGMHLLVAEDNALNREVITELLAMHGITCACAENGVRCLEILKLAGEGAFDAILMDMQMPLMDGIETTRQIRQLPLPWAKKIPIIAMTANAMKADVERCIEAGMNEHLSKPVDMTKMLKTLSRVRR